MSLYTYHIGVVGNLPVNWPNY